MYPLLVGLDLIHKLQCDNFRNIAQFRPSCSFICDDDPKENGRIPCPVGAEVVTDSNHRGGEGLRSALYSRINLLLVHESVRNVCHSLIISRLDSQMEFLLGLVRDGTSADADGPLEALEVHRESPEIRAAVEAAVRDR
jgi:hypothetical protein